MIIFPRKTFFFRFPHHDFLCLSFSTYPIEFGGLLADELVRVDGGDPVPLGPLLGPLPHQEPGRNPAERQQPCKTSDFIFNVIQKKSL